MGLSSSVQPEWEAQQWPWAFGTSPWMSKSSFVVFRAILALIFVVTATYRAVDAIFVKEVGAFYFILLTEQSLLLETVMMVVLFLLAWMASEAPDPDPSVQEEPSPSEPCLVRVGVVLFAIAQPLSLGVVILYWTLLTPIQDVISGVIEVPDYLSLFVHGIDWLLMLISLSASRIPYSCGRALWVGLFGLLYAIWTYLHFLLRIGKPAAFPCDAYPDDLSLCPIYSVLDWNDPASAAPVAVIAAIGAGTVLPLIYVVLVRLRDACDSRQDVTQEMERMQMERMRLLSEQSQDARPMNKACLGCA